MSLADRVKNPGRFTAFAVAHDFLTFHTLVAVNLFGEDVKTPGVYSVSCSLPTSRVERNELVLAHPKRKEPKG